jgi:hypothetical protein
MQSALSRNVKVGSEAGHAVAPFLYSLAATIVAARKTEIPSMLCLTHAKILRGKRNPFEANKIEASRLFQPTGSRRGRFVNGVPLPRIVRISSYETTLAPPKIVTE